MVTPPSAPRKKGRRDYEIINFPKIFQKNSKLGEKKREGGGGRREEEMTPFFLFDQSPSTLFFTKEMIIILPLLKKKIIFSFTFHTFPRLTRQTFRSLLSLDLPAELLRGPTRSRHQINTHLPSHLCLPPPLSLYQDWPGSLLPAQIVSFVECRSLQAAQRCRTTPALSFFSTTISCCHLTPIAGFVEITWKEDI